MDDELRTFWHTYYCRASQWAEGMTPEIYNTALGVLISSHLGKAFTTLGKQVFVDTTYHDLDSIAEYIDEPKKCTKNPFVYHSMENINNLDLKWIQIMTKNRSDNYQELESRLTESAAELATPNKCYDSEEIVSLMKAIISPSP